MLIILTATMSWTWPDTLSPIKSTEANLRAHLSWLSLQNRKITEKVEQNRSRFIKMIFKIKLASLIIEQKFPFSHCHKMEGHAIRMQEKLRIYNAHLSHQHFQYNFPILCNHRLAFFTYNARGSNRIINLSDHSLKMWNDMVKSNKRSSQVNDNIIAKPTEAKPCPTNRWYNYITKWHLFSLHLDGETLLEVITAIPLKHTDVSKSKDKKVEKKNQHIPWQNEAVIIHSEFLNCVERHVLNSNDSKVARKPNTFLENLLQPHHHIGL